MSLVSLIPLVLLVDARLHRWCVVPLVRFSLKEFRRQRATRRVRARVHFVDSPAGSSRPQGTVYPQRPPGVLLPPANTRLARARAAPAFYPRRPPGFWPPRSARGPTAASSNRPACAPILWPSGPRRRAGPQIWAFLQGEGGARAWLHALRKSRRRIDSRALVDVWMVATDVDRCLQGLSFAQVRRCLGQALILESRLRYIASWARLHDIGDGRSAARMMWPLPPVCGMRDVIPTWMTRPGTEKMRAKRVLTHSKKQFVPGATFCGNEALFTSVTDPHTISAADRVAADTSPARAGLALEGCSRPRSRTQLYREDHSEKASFTRPGADGGRGHRRYRPLRPGSATRS